MGLVTDASSNRAADSTRAKLNGIVRQAMTDASNDGATDIQEYIDYVVEAIVEDADAIPNRAMLKAGTYPGHVPLIPNSAAGDEPDVRAHVLTIEDAMAALAAAHSGLQDASAQGMPMVIALQWAVYGAQTELGKRAAP